MDDLISRQAAIDAYGDWYVEEGTAEGFIGTVKQLLEGLPSAQPESTRTFVELVVEYPDPELCTYKEYRGKPYYSIKYIENGETYVGYGTYKPEVLSRYLREYFMSSAQPERKTGRWIERNPQNSPDCRLIECSECGNAYIVGYNIDYDDWIDGRDFCMRCGADLRGGSNGKST